jgi:hypothetical protein
MKTIKNLDIQVKALIISTIVLTALFVTMVTVYGFKAFL